MPSHLSLKASRKFWRARRIILKSSKKKGKRLKLNYAVYVRQVLNEVLPYIEITPRAMEILNVFLNYIFERIAIEASKQAQCNGESKIDTIEIQYAVLQVFQRGDLAMHSMWAGLTALREYCTPQDK
jgi:histone H2B